MSLILNYKKSKYSTGIVTVSLVVIVTLVVVAIVELQQSEQTEQSLLILTDLNVTKGTNQENNDASRDQQLVQSSTATHEELAQSTTTTSSTTELKLAGIDGIPSNLQLWDDCNIEQICQRVSKNNKEKKQTPKPLWLSGYPSSGDELIRPRLLDTILNQKAAAKNFYTKKCVTYQPNTITATCSQVHPVIGINPTPVERKNNFDTSVLMLIRNPAMVYAAHYQEKANKYHHVEGQVTEKNWRNYRDEYLETGFHSWFHMLDTWKSYAPTYNISYYIQFEKLYDFVEGPKIVENLIKIFDQVGFDNLPSLDDGKNHHRRLEETSRQLWQSNSKVISCAQCIWYKTITKENIIKYHANKKYEFPDYVPGFTTPQRDYFTNQLDGLLQNKTFSNEKTLFTILKEYRKEIQTDIRIDE